MSKEKVSFWSPENLRQLSVMIVLILCFRWSVASPYHVPTASMEPTIKVGDRLLAFKLSYGLKIPFTDIAVIEWGKPVRGDIIVFQYPKDTSIDYVKRVIGVPGDRIRFKDDVIYINGKAQELEPAKDPELLRDIQDRPTQKNLFRERLGDLEHWVIQDKRPSSEMQYYMENWPQFQPNDFVVPDGTLFVSGDNRDNSTDSRVWGTVPLSYVRGKAIMVLWSWADVEALRDNFLKFRYDRFGWLLG